jgi:hypothetical protein
VSLPIVSLLPPQPGVVLPAPMPLSGLTPDELNLTQQLAVKLAISLPEMDIANNYYEGTQRIADLGIAMPEKLASVRTVVDWPRICIDPIVQRATVDGFRLPGKTETDSELWDYWQANDLDAESPLCFLDSLVYGRGYMIVGSGEKPGDPPAITVESPLNMAMTWDPLTRRTTSALQTFQVEGIWYAALYLPNVTIRMQRTDNTPWEVSSRDAHNLGEVPVVRFANRQRSAAREGCSEISAAIKNTTDSACRSLLGMEIAREFYSVPHRYVLGVNEDDLVDAAGNQKTALQLSLNKFLAFTGDENGNTPTVGQFTAFDPSVFTKIVDTHAQLMSSFTGFPPSYFGLTSTANPASADAIRVADNGLNRRASRFTLQCDDPLERVMSLAWRIAHNGAELPEKLRHLETDWKDVATPTPAATTDAITKQIHAGVIPPRSDVTQSKLGYSAVERARLAADYDEAEQLLAEVADNAIAQELRANATVTKAVVAANAPEDPAQPANPAAPAVAPKPGPHIAPRRP